MTLPTVTLRKKANAVLELAYALTVHKSQGSQFGTVILVLPNPCHLLSRELLYTALTRQKDRIVILHQGPAYRVAEVLLRRPLRNGAALDQSVRRAVTRGDQWPALRRLPDSSYRSRGNGALQV